MRGRILIAEDDPDTLELLQLKLEQLGYQVTGSDSAETALANLEERDFDVLLTDYEMGGLSGTQLCAEVQALRPDVPTILMTGHGKLEVAVEALKAGAFDFLTKPIEMELVRVALDRAIQTRELKAEVHRLQSAMTPQALFPEIVGESKPMKEVFQLLEQAAKVDISVLITGETGTGKEVVARALHDHSPRREGPFLAVNCAAFPEQLLESELFGHVKGAFTDAKGERRGIFVQANEGTLFLDEIGDMPASLQSKLLRALQERRVRPLGSEKEIPFDVRVLAATNQSLSKAIQEGTFRQDLYFRLNVLEVTLPPLRRRGQDILILAQRFLEMNATRLEKDVKGISPEAAGRLLKYAWTGNVRELQNCMERAVVVAQHEDIRVSDLPEAIRDSPAYVSEPTSDLLPEQLESLAQIEARHIAQVLAATDGNKLRCAKILGVDRTTLYRKLDRYSIVFARGARG